MSRLSATLAHADNGSSTGAIGKERNPRQHREIHLAVIRTVYCPGMP
jgi:hypothetical protein